MAIDFDALKRYIGFTATDAAVLRSLAPLVEPHLPDLAERFYGLIQAHAEAAAVFSGGRAQIDRLKVALQQWARELFSGTYDATYAQRRLRIGVRHVEVRLSQHYVLGALHAVETFLVRIFMQSISDPVESARAQASLRRLLTLDTCLLCDSYVEARLDNSDRLTRQLQEDNSRLEQARHDQAAFLAVVSHELRAPLTSLLGFATLLAEGHAPADTDRQAIGDEIARAGRYVRELLDDFTDLSRLDQGLLSMTLVPVALESALQAIVGLFRERALSKGLQLTYDADPRLVVTADAKRLRQVLVNIVGNSLKFTDAGAIALSARAEPPSPHALIVVQDTGVGIPADRHARVFERFCHFDSDDAVPRGGIGLGLAISRELMERMGGAIALASPGVGLGTTVTLQLPLTNAWESVATEAALHRSVP